VKLFTLDEANAMLAELEPKLRRIKTLYAALDPMRESAKVAAACAGSGGGMVGGSAYVKTLYEIGKVTTEIHEAGVELKDHKRGLIDFPSLMDGRVVYLCWQLDDLGGIRWWHELDAGFAGRTLIPEEP
jgi:hypothetical protein